MFGVQFAPDSIKKYPSRLVFDSGIGIGVGSSRIYFELFKPKNTITPFSRIKEGSNYNGRYGKLTFCAPPSQQLS